MKVTRINPPKYKVGRYSINEYELRCLMLEVAEGKQMPGLKVTDKNKITATILPEGRLSNNIYGLDINSNYTISMLRINRNKI